MNCRLIEIPKIKDPRGNLSVIQADVIPFQIKRVYYLYDVPSGEQRGGHAHINQAAFLVALSGSFDVVVHNGSQQKTYTLNKPNVGLLINPGTWRSLNNFSSGSVCLVVSPEDFDESDYIRDFDVFLKCYK